MRQRVHAAAQQVARTVLVVSEVLARDRVEVALAEDRVADDARLAIADVRREPAAVFAPQLAQGLVDRLVLRRA
jgi:hypothetical protein